MPREPKPWQRSGRGGDWYAQIKRQQIRLADASASQTEAYRALYKILGSDGKPRRGAQDKPPLYYVLGQFLERAEAECKPSTLETYQRYFRRMERMPQWNLPAGDLKPADVYRWVKGFAWAEATRGAAITAVKVATRWAAKAKMLPEDPLAGMPYPARVSRSEIPTTDQVGALLESTAGKPVGALLAFVAETGCRLGEAIGLEASSIDLKAGVAVVAEHKTRGRTGRPKLIVLTEAARRVVEAQAASWPEGKLFRNQRGTHWRLRAVEAAVRRHRKKLGLGREMIPHGLRHRFATEVLKQAPNAVVAALLGHTTTATVDRVYSKIAREVETLREAAERAKKA